jgi:predicted dehydrogenase
LQGARRGDPSLADIEVPAELRWAPAEVPDGSPVNLGQMMRRFAEGIRSGDQPTPTFTDAVRNHKLLEAIERSSQTGRSVKIED